MMKRTQLILLFIVAFSGAFLLGNLPVGGQETAITGASFDGGQIVTDLIGQSPRNPCYNPNPDDPESECKPMYPVEELWICNGEPDTKDFTNCLPFNFSTLGAAYNTWVLWGGRWRYIAP